MVASALGVDVSVIVGREASTIACTVASRIGVAVGMAVSVGGSGAEGPTQAITRVKRDPSNPNLIVFISTV